jgi:hypothetical protein
LIAALDASDVKRWINDAALIYPLANTAHVIGAILLAGTIILLDLRVLNYARALPADALSRAVTPLAASGLALLLASGAILFLSDPRTLAGSPLFQAKLGLIALALLNALAFRRRWRLVGEVSPPRARLMAALSIVLWLSVVILGRLIAYF